MANSKHIYIYIYIFIVRRYLVGAAKLDSIEAREKRAAYSFKNGYAPMRCGYLVGGEKVVGDGGGVYDAKTLDDGNYL